MHKLAFKVFKSSQICLPESKLNLYLVVLKVIYFHEKQCSCCSALCASHALQLLTIIAFPFGASYGRSVNVVWLHSVWVLWFFASVRSLPRMPHNFHAASAFFVHSFRSRFLQLLQQKSIILFGVIGNQFQWPNTHTHTLTYSREEKKNF